MTLQQLKEEIRKWNNPATLSHDEIFDLVDKARELGRSEIIENIHTIEYPKKTKSLFGSAYSYYKSGCDDTRRSLIESL